MPESISSYELTDELAIQHFLNLVASESHKAQMTTSLADNGLITMRSIEYALQNQEKGKDIIALYKNKPEEFSEEVKEALDEYLKVHPEIK